jgi:hypothetical protein
VFTRDGSTPGTELDRSTPFLGGCNRFLGMVQPA